jgi:tripartite-type tricarboxylate transporter receptor subunit TctC
VRPDRTGRNYLIVGGCLACAALVCQAHASAAAESYPSKSVRIIVPYTPGGGIDFIGRVVAQELAKPLGQTVLVDNRPGGSTMIGSDLVAKAAPDGHTLLVSPQTSMAVAPNIFQKIGYDPVRDFAAITIAGASPMLLVVHPAFPAKTLPEFIALARSRPGQMSFGSGGIGSGPHMAGELLNGIARLGLVHVPYKGENPAIIDVAGGQIPFILGTLPAVLPLVQAGRLRAIAATSEKRSSLAPQFPTFAQSGLPGFDATVWLGLFAPAATPRDIVNRIHGDLGRIMATADAREKLGQQGVEYVGNTPEQFGAYLKAELAKWGKVVKQAGIRPD